MSHIQHREYISSPLQVTDREHYLKILSFLKSVNEIIAREKMICNIREIPYMK